MPSNSNKPGAICLTGGLVGLLAGAGGSIFVAGTSAPAALKGINPARMSQPFAQIEQQSIGSIGGFRREIGIYGKTNGKETELSSGSA